LQNCTGRPDAFEASDLADRIKKFGFRNPVLIDDAKQIIAGFLLPSGSSVKGGASDEFFDLTVIS
jgi:hypothetical protein